MFAPDLVWFYPKSPEEAVSLLAGRPDAAFHGGGTGLLRVKSPAIGALIDLARAGLSSTRSGSGVTVVGAAVTYTDFIRARAKAAPSVEMLRAAVGAAAATPLRNRITFGGSVADRPIWSDLWPALLCLDAELSVLNPDGTETLLAAAEYLEKRIFRGRHLVREICVPEKDLFWFTRRGTRTGFDYPVFSLGFAAENRGGVLHGVRAAVSGTTRTVEAETGAAAALEGRPLSADVVEAAAEALGAEFASDGEFSGEYKKHWLRTVFADGLLSLIGGAR